MTGRRLSKHKVRDLFAKFAETTEVSESGNLNQSGFDWMNKHHDQSVELGHLAGESSFQYSWLFRQYRNQPNRWSK
jgi:hypothetical protein